MIVLTLDNTFVFALPVHVLFPIIGHNVLPHLLLLLLTVPQLTFTLDNTLVCCAASACPFPPSLFIMYYLTSSSSSSSS